MLRHGRIKTGKRSLETLLFELPDKNLIVLKGRNGFIMCGYLDIKVADKFGDTAVRITGVSTIKEALNSKAHSCSKQAAKLGIYPGQPIKDVIRLIA